MAEVLPVSRVIVVVEGQTEQDFVRDVLAPWLGARGVYLSARLVGKPGHKGGVGEYRRARTDILILLKSEPVATVTTMFDFFRMPESWPGRREASAKPTAAERAAMVERAILDDVVAAMGPSFRSDRFLPYVQMHEFEALIFVDPSVTSEVLGSPGMAMNLQRIRSEFASPEEIDDGSTTAPSKRLESLFGNYRKRLHGPIITNRIGFEALRSACPHFAGWLESLLRCRDTGGAGAETRPGP